ncbi:MAG: uroporphyrinogen-III synthase [Actinobacteria bacterium]|nr:uroporphyrinogen-III synthase [Actinomycetota bacterium]
MVGTPGPLAGRRVVVTRAIDQADELAAMLRERGAEPVLVPLVQIIDVADELARLSALRPAEFEWLVVTSPNGARSYARVHSWAPAHVAAVGTATAAALAEHGVSVTLVPAVQRAEGLLSEFPDAPADGGTVLLVQAVDAEPTMADGLEALGWRVTAVTPYRTVTARPTPGEFLAALAADAVLFASGSAASSWVRIFGTSAPPLVVAIGPRTAAATRGFGLKVDLIATDHSMKGLVDALEHHLDPRV